MRRSNPKYPTIVLLTAAAVTALAASSPTHARSFSGARGSASWGGGSGSAEGHYGGSAAWSAGQGGSATTANGGTANWGGGSRSATSANGGTYNRTLGEGGSATTAAGGSAAWSGHDSGSVNTAYGSSATWNHGTGSATNAYGEKATWNHNTYYGAPPPAAYHPPTAYYGHPPAPAYYPAPVYRPPAYGGAVVYTNNGYNATTGEVAAAGVAGLAVGAAMGASAAKSSQSSTTYSTQQAAYSSPTAINSPLPMGTQLSALPPGCTNAVVKSVEYYGCGPNWFKPVFGGGGVYYKVVPQPF